MTKLIGISVCVLGLTLALTACSKSGDKSGDVTKPSETKPDETTPDVKPDADKKPVAVSDSGKVIKTAADEVCACKDEACAKKVGDRMQAWAKAKRIARVEDFRFHDLRHHSCGTLLKEGIPAWQVQKIGGWKDRSMLERYHQGDPIEAARLTREKILPSGENKKMINWPQSEVGLGS